ncbi:MAG TPA: DNA-3-methyladenine glycosylase, partial [Polyangiales bacterium]
FAGLLAFLRARAIAGVEHVTEQRYARVIELNGALGILTVWNCPERNALRVVVPFPALAALPRLTARVRHVFDLGSDPRVIARDLSRDALLAPLVKARPGLRLPGAWDGFELAVRGVLGQQITVQAATRLASQLVARVGRPLSPELLQPGLTHAFPSPARFDATSLSQLGMPRARIATLIALARAVEQDPRLFEGGLDLERAVARLVELPGIGPWTAHYIAMRALAESDAFPVGDIGLLRAVAQDGARPTPKQLSLRAEAWRPWRAYATLHLWTEDAAQRVAPKVDDAARSVARVRLRREVRDALAS